MNRKSRITGLCGKERAVFFLLCFVTSLIPVLYPVIAGHGMYFIADDFMTQQVPFITYLSGMVKKGIDTWAWDVDLGSSTIQAFSFYELGSPFFWLIALFPQWMAPYLIGPAMILKYLVACYTAQMYLKRFTRTAWNAVPGALLYAFSGFQSTNLSFNHFHDVVAFFPLMLVGLEMVMDEHDPAAKTRHGLFFAAAVCLNAVVNYFFFVQSTIFLVIYYLVRFSAVKQPKRMLHDLPRILFYALLGAGMAGLILIPNYYYVLQNPRSSQFLLGQKHFYSLNHFMYMIKGLLMPGDIMWDETALLKYSWTSTSAHLPFIGFCFVFAYMLKKRDWLFWALAVFILLGLFPETNAMFLLFTTDYQRWWYGIVILAALATVLVAESPEEYPLRKGVCIQAVLLVLLRGYLAFARDYNFNSGNSALYHPLRFHFFLSLMVPGMIYAWMLGTKKPVTERRGKILLICISLFAMLTTTYNEYRYKKLSPVSEDTYILMQKTAQDMPGIEPEYRYQNFENTKILFSNAKNTSGNLSYTSTVSPALSELDTLFEYYADNSRVYKHIYAGFPQAVAARYLVDSGLNYTEAFPQAILDAGEEYTRYSSNGVECVVKAYNAAQIGYRTEHYITEAEWYKVPLEDRGVELLYAPCVKDDETGMKLGLQPVTVAEILAMIQQYPENTEGSRLLVSPLLDELCVRNNAGCVKDFDRDEHGFTCRTDYAEDSTVFFSIPADEGWHITIDGENTDFTDAGGLMLLRVPGGEHMIRGVYHCPYFRTGCMISTVCAALFAALYIFRRKLLI